MHKTNERIYKIKNLIEYMHH